MELSSVTPENRERLASLQYTGDIRQKILTQRFPVWQKFLQELERTAEPEHTLMRFPNSSSYLFSSGSSCFWMVDPAFSTTAEPDSGIGEIMDLIRQKIHFIVLTHLHGDHCQFDLIRGLAGAGITFVLPDSLATDFQEQSGIPPEELCPLKPGESVTFSGITITAGAGYHAEPGKIPVLSASYDITLPDGIRLFLPGDVRDYSAQVPDSPVDYTIGHVFLGREDATGSTFSCLDRFCDFITRREPAHLILTHLYEIGRNPPDLWTHRHALMAADKIRQIKPGISVDAPFFGETLLLKKESVTRDPFINWNIAGQQEFINSLGISLKTDHCRAMERVIAEKIPALEWSWNEVENIPLPQLLEQISRWRAAGGKCLSLHLRNFPVPGDRQDQEKFNFFVQMAIAGKFDRVTVHSPHCILAEVPEKLDKLLAFCAEVLMPLVHAGITIGIENLHMKPYYKPDETRPYGFIPSEFIHLVKELRRLCDSPLIGCHVDMGHAYSNAPYSDQYPPEEWLKMCAPMLNGLHLHQFEYAATPEDPYLTGHANITGRNTGHPNLSPLFELWQNKAIRVPMFLEVCRGPAPDPFRSLQIMREIFL